MKRNTLLLWIILINCLGLHAQRTSLNMHLPDVDLGCIDDLSDVPRPDARSVKSESNCEAGVVDIKHIDDFVISQNCSSKLYRIYQAKDGCGLQVRDTQMYSFVLDTLRPMQKIEIDLGCNPDLDKVIPDPKKLDLGDCLKDFKWLGDERDDRKCRKTLIRTYEIYSCRNKYALVYCYQWIEDLEAPEIQCPDNVHFGCDYSGVPPADPGLVKASDNCCVDSVWWGGDIIISAFDTCEHTLLRRYWAVDCCGNLSYCDQVFNWYSFPNDPVIISCPLGADLGCNIDPSTDIPPATPELVIVDEMCGDYQVTSSLSDITVFIARTRSPEHIL